MTLNIGDSKTGEMAQNDPTHVYDILAPTNGSLQVRVQAGNAEGVNADLTNGEVPPVSAAGAIGNEVTLTVAVKAGEHHYARISPAFGTANLRYAIRAQMV